MSEQCPFRENGEQCQFKTSDNLVYIQHKEEHEKRIREEDYAEFQQYCKEHPFDCTCTECAELNGVICGMITKSVQVQQQ